MFRIDPQHLLWTLENLVAGRVVNQIKVARPRPRPRAWRSTHARRVALRRHPDTCAVSGSSPAETGTHRHAGDTAWRLPRGAAPEPPCLLAPGDGEGVAQLLAGEAQQWTPPPREIGALCGTRSFGLGRFLYRGLPRPNDGLLTVKESAFPAAQEHLVLPVSHTGMMFSREVAEQVGNFLAFGRFSR
jgi:hypothetical protein